MCLQENNYTDQIDLKVLHISLLLLTIQPVLNVLLPFNQSLITLTDVNVSRVLNSYNTHTKKTQHYRVP